MTISKYLALAIVAGLLSACSVTEPENHRSPEQTCSKVKALLGAYDNNFDALKGRKHQSPRVAIWATDKHLVGRSCEIWGWGNGNTNYLCSHAYPDEQAARADYEKAKSGIHQCLGDDWQMSEQPRQLGTGDRAVFQQGHKLPAVSVHVVQTQGVFKSGWSAYVFIGDLADSL